MTASALPSTEFHPYFGTYLSQVGSGTLDQCLENGRLATKSFFENIPEARHNLRYAEGKWTPREILAHLIDSERMFCYRALTIARTDDANLPGFDENVFVANSKAELRTMEDLVDEYTAVRDASIHFFKNLPDETLQRTGMANEHMLSVRAAGFIICGHEQHHRRVITERYLSL